MDELIAFVRQQLDEDEGLARAADEKRHRAIVTDALARPEIGTHNNARLIAEWDPARVLAEVEAKRRILDWVEGAQAAAGDPPGFDLQDAEALTHAVRLLAQPYAGREGWREEWRA